MTKKSSSKKKTTKRKPAKKSAKKSPKKKVSKKKTVKKKTTKKKTVKKSSKKKVAKKKPAKKKAVKKKTTKKKTTKKKSSKKGSSKSRLKKKLKPLDAEHAALREEFDFSNVPTYAEAKKSKELKDIFAPQEPLDISKPAKMDMPPKKKTLPNIDLPDTSKPSKSATTAYIEDKSKKKGFWAGLFKSSDKPKKTKQKKSKPKKEKKPIVTKSIKKGFKQDISDAKGAKKNSSRTDEIYLENMHRRMDSEIKERHSHLDEKETHLGKKEKEMQKKEQSMLKKEFDMAKKDKEYEEIKALQDELESQKLSLEYQKQKIEELKSELALKDADLRQKEINLDGREKQLRDAEEFGGAARAENINLHNQISEEDDAIEYLEQEIAKQRSEFERKMHELKIGDVQDESIVSKIHDLINECYAKLSEHNLDAVGNIYAQVRDLYVQEAKEHDSNGTLYKDIMQLYDAINKQVA